MHFSKRLKSSPHCLPSPDGRLLAALFPSVINIRRVETLEVDHVVKLPQDLSGPVLSFQWSPCSRHVLVAVTDQIHVFSASEDPPFHAVIRSPAPPAAKPAFVSFGPEATEVCAVGPPGLKFALYGLRTSKSVEIGNPKFSGAAAARRGFCFRPRSRHMALLTRVAGKDMISIHHPSTREMQQAWSPDAVDIQGLLWSPDGRWLVAWESPAHGHKVLFHTADGHTFRRWTGPRHLPGAGHGDDTLGTGVKHVQFSPDALHLAIGDSSRGICMFDMASIREAARLQHPTSMAPTEAIQVWQEQVTATTGGPSVHTFVKAVQPVCPPGRPSSDDAKTSPGCSHLSFDASSSLLAVKLDEFPSTVWIWDIGSSELRAVLMFHAEVSTISWHPTIRETLLLGCDDSEYRGLMFVWDPLSNGPISVGLRHGTLPAETASHKPRCVWVSSGDQEPVVFYSDGVECWLAAPMEGGIPSWAEVTGGPRAGASPAEESPLDLVPAAGRTAGVDILEGGQMQSASDRGTDSECEVQDDTFHYKLEGKTRSPGSNGADQPPGNEADH